NDSSPESWTQSDLAPTADALGHGPRTATLVVSTPTSQRIHDSDGLAPTLQSSRSPNRGGSEGPMGLISSLPPPPVRTSPCPDNAAASNGPAPASSSNTRESLSLFAPDGFSGRTYRGHSVRTAVGTSDACLPRWPTSGTAWPTGFSTHVSSECRSDGAECSS